MNLRFLAAALLSLLTLCSSANTQIRLPKPNEIRDAMEQHDLGTAEKLLRDYERADNAGFSRNNYDYLLARVLDRAGKAAEAAKAYQKVVARNSVLAAYALWHLAELARAAGDLKEEQVQLQRLVAQYPGWLNRERALQRLGASYFKSGQYQQVITTLAQISGTRGMTARYSLAQTGEAQLALNQTAAARTTFESLLNGGFQDDAALKAIIGLDHIDESARTQLTEAEHLRRARTCDFNRDFATARKHWLAIASEFPSSTARAEALYQLGRGYELEDKFAEAIPWYNKVHDEFPKKEEGEKGVYYVGHCYQYLKDADRAIARYEEFLKAYPTSEYVGYAHLNTIDTLRIVKRDDEALRWAARAQALPDAYFKVTGLFHQARIHVSQSNFAAALEDFNTLRARNLSVRGLVATTNLPEVNFMRAYCLEQLGRFDEAITAYLTLPEGRNSASGYYGYRASERLQTLSKNLRAKNTIARLLQGFLSQARASQQPAGEALASSLSTTKKDNASGTKTAAAQVLRLTDDEQIRREMLDVLRAAYAKLPGYRLSQFTLIPAGRTALRDANAPALTAADSGNHQALADELFFLGLYDEGAPEMAATGNQVAASAYSMAVYFNRGDRGDHAINLAEPLFNSVPDDYRPELMPRALAEMLYPAPYHDALQKHAVPRNVDPKFVLSIMRQESRFKPSVKSPAAARGLLQFISSTSSQIAAQLKLADFEQEDLYTPDVAILIGSQYMQNLFNEFGNWQAVAAAYNGSEQHVRRCLERARSTEVDRFVIEVGKRETKDYVYKVMNNLQAYRALYQ
ncbi:MAG TPA: tetratricopeptide repeat protein [Blastocatellia bacterium]|nr:tetratricopeptide repeat protein [Blastocatellia bacterium]